MHVFPNDPPLPNDVSEEDINDIFGHHGWKIVAPRLGLAATDTHLLEPVQHEEADSFGMSSRGHPLFIGSPYQH